MQDNDFVTDVGFVHDPYRDMHSLHLLEQADVILRDGNEKIPRIDKDAYQELAYLSFFAFYYREKVKHSNPQDWGYLILGEDQFASLLSDSSQLISPIHSARVKRQPLEDLGHAFGHCMTCPAKTFLGNNMGKSNIAETVGLVQDIESPNTYEYSMYSEEGNDRWSHDEYGDCNECQKFMSKWFRNAVQEEVNYLWGMGGTGLVHQLNIDTEEYNVLEAIAGREPPIKTVKQEYSLLARDQEQLEEQRSEHPGPEYIFNLLLAISFCVEYDLDDFKLNCEIHCPKKLSFEYDIILLNYEAQKLVVIETTAESKMDTSDLKTKQNAALQIQILAQLYGFEILYIYLTTATDEKLSSSSGTTLVQEEWDTVQTICCPTDIDLDVLDPERAVHHSPEAFGTEFRRLYDSLVARCQKEIEAFTP